MQETGWQSGPLSADCLLTPRLTIGARLVESTHEVWSDFAVQSAAAQTCIFDHIERETCAALASGSVIVRYSRERMHDLAATVCLWQQFVSTIVPLTLLPEKCTHPQKWVRGPKVIMALASHPSPHGRADDESLGYPSGLTRILKGAVVRNTVNLKRVAADKVMASKRRKSTIA